MGSGAVPRIFPGTIRMGNRRSTPQDVRAEGRGWLIPGEHHSVLYLDLDFFCPHVLKPLLYVLLLLQWVYVAVFELFSGGSDLHGDALGVLDPIDNVAVYTVPWEVLKEHQEENGKSDDKDGYYIYPEAYPHPSWLCRRWLGRRLGLGDPHFIGLSVNHLSLLSARQ